MHCTEHCAYCDITSRTSGMLKRVIDQLDDSLRPAYLTGMTYGADTKDHHSVTALDRTLPERARAELQLLAHPHQGHLPA